MRNHLIGATLLATATAVGWVGTAHADLIIINSSSTCPTGVTCTFKAEGGQSIPTGTPGFLGGELIAQKADPYTFTYGPPPPLGLAGGTGHGNSTFLNEFRVIDNNNVAHYFCTQAGMADCGGRASVVGNSFTIGLNANEVVPFAFLYDLGNGTGGHTLTNGQQDNANGGYLDQLIGNGSNPTIPNGSPSAPFAYLGLSDNSLPPTGTDQDFQDLTVLVTEVPEPTSMALLGTALFGVAFGFRRKTSRT